MDNKKYIIYRSDFPQYPVSPYFFNWLDLVGEKEIYDFEDIKKISLTLSKTKGQRLLKLKPGTALQLSYLSRGVELMIRRVSKEEEELLFEKNSIQEKIKKVNQEIRKSCPLLFENLSLLKKEERKLQKRIDKFQEKIIKQYGH